MTPAEQERMLMVLHIFVTMALSKHYREEEKFWVNDAFMKDVSKSFKAVQI